MANDTPTIGERLRALRDRSGMSMRDLAARTGFSHASGLQRYVEGDYNKPLRVDFAGKLADALAGLGDPAVTRDEVMALAARKPEPNARVQPFEGASAERMREDLPVFGTALGAARIVEDEAVEQTTLNRGEVVHYAKRPVVLNGRADAYGLYVAGSSMAPVHLEGDLVLVERKRPPRIGDDVVVYLRPDGDDDDGERARAVLIKRLVRRTATFYELEQYSPAITFRIDACEVLRVDRVMRLADFLS